MITTDILGLDITRINHDCFKIKTKNKVIYFDPFKISKDEPADLILVTHEHFDHCSVEDIEKILKDDTVIIASAVCRNELSAMENRVKNIVYFKPNEKKTINDFQIETIPAYNVNKFRDPGVPFHPKGEDRIGFVITVEGKRIYHAGDTDVIPEMKNLKNIDIALIPVSGTYVMTAEEATEAVKMIKPKIIIPMHFGSIVGSKKDAERFKELVKDIEVKILG